MLDFMCKNLMRFRILSTISFAVTTTQNLNHNINDNCSILKYNREFLGFLTSTCYSLMKATHSGFNTEMLCFYMKVRMNDELVV